MYRLFRMLPGADRRMLLKQYIKVIEVIPEAADEVWQMLQQNWKFQKKNKKNIKIVSLGWGCMIRTYTTLYMLKPVKSCGEKSMPFDLVMSPAATLLHFLKTDFSDYFTGEWFYDYENSWWANDPATGVYYAHDKDCGPDDLKKLTERISKRIDNFREVMDFPGMLFFIIQKRSCDDARLYQEIKEELARKRQGKPFRMLVLACDLDEKCREIDGLEYAYYPYPSQDHIWHEPEMRFTPIGMKYELAIAKIFRDFICS